MENSTKETWGHAQQRRKLESAIAKMRGRADQSETFVRGAEKRLENLKKDSGNSTEINRLEKITRGHRENAKACRTRQKELHAKLEKHNAITYEEQVKKEENRA